MLSSALVRSLIVAGCLLATTAYLGATFRAEVIPPHEPLATVPMQFDGWRGYRQPDFTEDILAILGVDDYITRSYAASDKAIVGLYVGYHKTQRQGDTIHSPLNCLPGAGWLPLEQGHISIPVAGSPGVTARPIEINRVVIGKGLERQLVLYWYQSHNRVVASEYWGKIYTVLDAVKYNRTDAAMVRVIAPITEAVPAALAEKQAVSFIQSLFPRLSRSLPS